MGWDVANTWANNLVYGRFDDCRLPTIVDTGMAACAALPSLRLHPRWRARVTALARGDILPRCAAYTVRRSASKNSSLCRRSPWVWAATRAARSASTGASGRPVLCASTWAWQARSR